MITKSPAYLKGARPITPDAGAIVPAPAAPAMEIVKVPSRADEAAKRQATAEEELALVLTVSAIESPEAYASADEMLTDFARDQDAAVSMRKSVTVPLYTGIRTVEAWFKPWVDARERAIRHLKKLMGDYQTARAEAEKEARTLALTAASTGDADAMLEGLALAQEIQGANTGRATVRYEWVIDHINPEELPREYWIPDLQTIAGVAKASGSSEEAPVIPGVTFKRQAAISAKRK